MTSTSAPPGPTFIRFEKVPGKQAGTSQPRRTLPKPGLDDPSVLMISDGQRSEEIRRRFANGDPLNLSAVEVDGPWLLEGLFDAENFKGWRESIELAGIPIAEIRIEPRTGVTCKECGFEGDTLRSHLQHAHGMNFEEYREAHSEAETSSEASRAERMADRHGRPAKAIIPHWEPAWSRNYALDRIHQFFKMEIPLNYSYVAKNEPGFPAYVRRAFPSWDAGLAAAGIKVGNVRRARESVSFSADQVVASLREKEQEKPSQLHIRAARSGGGKTVIAAAFRRFGSYEKALAAAGITPSTKLPALANKTKVRARETLLRETMKNLKTKPPYVPVEVKRFIDKHASAIKDFYGSWANFAASLKRVERDLFNSPGHLRYDSKEACIAALRERAEVGLSLRQGDVRTDNPSLEIMGEKHFGSHSRALKAANVMRLPHSYDQRSYAEGDQVVAEIRRRHQNGESLYYSDLQKKDGDRSLLKWSARFFGSFPEAIAAAGVPHPGSKSAKRGRFPKTGTIF